MPGVCGCPRLFLVGLKLTEPSEVGVPERRELGGAHGGSEALGPLPRAHLRTRTVQHGQGQDFVSGTSRSRCSSNMTATTSSAVAVPRMKDFMSTRARLRISASLDCNQATRLPEARDLGSLTRWQQRALGRA